MADTKHILLVDDDNEFRNSLSEQLGLLDEFKISQAATGNDALMAVKTADVDLILLDVELGDLEGFEVCRLIRAGGQNMPIIMLTALDTDSDTVLALDYGANDYVAKPFRFGVLLARIRAQLRDHEKFQDATFNIGTYKFRPSVRLLVDESSGRQVKLTEKESAILKYMCQAGETTVYRDDLLRDVWSYNSTVTTHTLETHIYRLRRKMETDPSKAKCLLTETGGYRLVR